MTAGIGAFFLAVQQPAELKASATAAIQIALEAEPSPPSPPAPDPEPPKVPRPVLHREIRQPDAAPLMAAVVSSAAEFESVHDSSPSEAVQAPPARSVASGNLDSQYAATLRTNIDSRTSLPTSAEYRLLKPHGEVRVNFTLDRSGMMVASELARSSGSTPLDRHALEIVRTGHYPPFPNDAFQGESSHSFFITLEFHS
jgi:protein TonB